MVVPYTDPAYYHARPSIAVPPPGRPGGALDLDGRFGLHPRLAPLLPLLHDGRLAIVHACGWPSPCGSHLVAQDDLMAGAPGGAGGEDSWVARAGGDLVEVGGWDFHAGQGGSTGPMAERLAELARVLTRAARAPGDPLVVAISEFGRTVAENDRGGTGHGHGGVMLVMGRGVRGGRVYGRWPGLAAALERPSAGLPVTTDLRDVLAEVAMAGLGIADVSGHFPGHTSDSRSAPGLFGPRHPLT